MADGDLLARRQGSIGIGAQTAAQTVRAGAPAHWLNADTANIEFTPNTYERVNNIGANKIGIQQSGNDYSFSFSNAECSAEEVAYLIWLFSGSSSVNTAETPDQQTISQTFDSKYFTIYKDHGGTFDVGNNRVERLVGCRFDSLTIEQPRAGYAKVSGSGLGLSLNPETTAYTPSVTLGADDAPLSWAALQSGDFQLKWDGGSFATVTAPTSVKLEFTREISAQGANLASNDYSEVVEGGRSLSFMVEMDLIEGDADCEALIAAAKNANDVEIKLDWTTGAQKLVFTSSPSRVVGSPGGEIGTSTDAQTLTLEAEAFDTGSDIYTTVFHGDIPAFS